MITEMTTTREAIVNDIIQKAWEDSNFKAALLQNPKAALQEMGVNAPDGLNIKVVEETSDTLYIVLPRNPIETYPDLDEGDFEESATVACSTISTGKRCC